MIEGLKPYNEYKESGLNWLGPIPVSWETPRTKTRFRLSLQKSGNDHGKELLSVYTRIGVRPRKDLEQRGNKASSTNDYWVVRQGDIIVNKLLAWMGAVGVSHFDGVTSPAYDILRPIQKLEPDFYHLLFRTKLYLQLFKSHSRGIMDMRLRLYFDQLGQIPLVCPPPDEQAAIVRFLDHANRRIDGFILKKKRELSLITEMLLTVTEESLINSDARVMRLSTAAELVHRPIDRRAGKTYTKIGLFNRGRGIFHKPPVCGAELGDSEFFWIQEGDLVISGQFAWEGAVALARRKDEGCVASHRYPILRGRESVISSSSLFAILRTRLGGMLMEHHSRGAAGRNRPLNINTLLKEKLSIPSRSAQIRITDLLEQEFSVAQTIARSIRLVDEYRTRLTADLVTGKLDVREAAARLPNLPAEAATEPLTHEAEEEIETVETA